MDRREALSVWSGVGAIADVLYGIDYINGFDIAQVALIGLSKNRRSTWKVPIS